MTASVVLKDKAGLQELADSVPDFDQDDVSLYMNSLQDKQDEQVDNLDDSLCASEENNCVVPSKDDLTQVTGSDNITDQLTSGENNCSLVDELFDDFPAASQNTSSSNSIASTQNDKKIAPLFSSTKKKKRFHTPVHSITDDNICRQADKGNNVQADDTKTEKCKPVFTSTTKIKPSIGKKRKLSETNQNRDEKITWPPAKVQKSVPDKHKSVQPVNSDVETNCNIDEVGDASSDDSGKKVSSTTTEDSLIAEANKKKKQKKSENKEENGTNKAKSCKQPGGGKTLQSVDAKTEKAKPVFKKTGTKPSAVKKTNLFEGSKDGDENVSEPPAKSDLKDDPKVNKVNFNIKEGTNSPSNKDSVKKSSSTANKDNSLTEKVGKKKREKTATESKEKKASTSIKKTKKVTKSKKEVDASKKKAAQQQAKIDISCKNLDREQRKAEKELQKISRELEKVRKQKGNKEKKVVETERPSDSSNTGHVWVQCDQPDCLKWRRLRDCNNPSEIPEQWLCSMNPDQQFNSCAVPEEESSDLNDSQEYVYATYAPGAMVWAKVTGYPWWPAMVQYDTNKDAFYEKHPSCHTPIAYHVVFFSKPVSRAWVHSLSLQAFLPDEDPNTKVAQKYSKPLTMAVKEAEEANQVSIEERLAKYSFSKLYTGKSMYYDDQWASSTGTRKRKRGAPKKTQDDES